MKPKLGLLPLYIELYDKAVPERRPRVLAFLRTIKAELEKRGMEIVAAPICRVKAEFAAAVHDFEAAQVDAILTLHLAYSPSLESAEALSTTKLPIIVLDSTPAPGFGPDQDPAEIFANHGIHGVQDMCNLLLRKRKSFQIEAGHWQRSDVLDRVAGWARAAKIAGRMRRARIGRIGGSFEGMGDFAVPPETLRDTIGIQTVPSDPTLIRSLLPDQDSAAVETEVASDLAKFASDAVSPALHRKTIQTCLAVRRWLEAEDLSGFTMNFLDIDQASGLPSVPFLEASKAMARGQGYAGEGDVLTAALVGSLASEHPTTFTEMFCPDWAGDSIFLSHMGEMNLDLAATKPRLVEKPFPWTDVERPVVAVGRFRPGDAVLANLAPGPNGAYTLIVAPVTMLGVEGEDRMADTVHGWLRPQMPVASFLAEYSRLGGTHHSALVYGDVADEVSRFGKLMGWNTVLLCDGRGATDDGDLPRR